MDERVALCRDLAVWLGSLQALEARPLHRRWIALSVLRRLNVRLPRPEALDGVRSELGTGRLRFLHYLAEAAGLVASTGARLLPTPAALRWFERPLPDQWAALWSALEADRRAGAHLWRRYRLPDVTEPAWTALIDRLRRAPPASYALESLVAAILPYCPPPFERWEDADRATAASIAALLDTVLAWMGIARRAGDRVEMPTRDGADAMPAHQRARIEETPAALLVRLPEHPAPLPLAQALAWADLDDWTLIVDAPAMRRAWGQGVSAVTAAGILAELCGPLPIAWLDRLQAWEREAHSLRLRRVPVLAADDPSVLDALCANRGLRALIDQPLSAHHLAVHADQVDALCRRLERRGFPVTHAQPAEASACSTSSGTSLDPAAAAYAYLAMRVFQKLADFAPLPLRLPAVARDTVAAHIANPSVIDDLDRMAERVLDALNRVIQGDAPLSPVQDAPAESIRTTLRHAYEAQEAVTIDYFSPARGAITTRRIAPLRWIERGGAVYVEAWCELDSDTRTFRVDRVLRVVSSPDPPGAAQDGDPEMARTGE
ncbi:MAG: WYL domain-containing protein [Chloroflexi bacterium]|nr:WYL domain-containing protein [Chloroflexota bacterium]